MAKLTGQTIAASYDQLLIVDDANGISSSLQAIESADTGGSASSLKISTSKVEVIPASDSTSLFEVSQNDGTPVLSVDTTNARVGIGTSSPIEKLHLAQSDSDKNYLQFTNSTTGHTASDGISIGMGDDESLVIYQREANIIIFGTSAATRMTIKEDGNVGIGDTSPDAHLDVEDATIDTAASYTGIVSSHTKTAGITDINDDLIGIHSDTVWADDNSLFGALIGGNFQAYSQLSAGESDAIYGTYTKARMAGSTDVANIYGGYSIVQVDAGTVDVNAYGHFVSANFNGGAIADSLIALEVDVDVATDPASIARGMNMRMSGANLDDNDLFIQGYDTEGGGNVAFKILRTGNATFDSGDFDGSPDYAEYFESKSGSVIPIGSTVKLDGDKIVACSEGEIPIGVVRPKNSPGIVSGTASLKWTGKYLRDDYDNLLYEDYTYIEWSEEITLEEYSARGKDETGGVFGGHVKDKQVKGSHLIPAKEAVLYEKGDDIPEGKGVGDVKKEAVEAVDAVADTYIREHRYYSDSLPEGLEVPDGTETIVPKNQRKKINPDFDNSIEYNPRKERDEWHVVGLLGQIPITKGQPLADNWIKMKDVSDTVEMYFVK